MHDNIAYGVKLIQQYYREGRNQGRSVNDDTQARGTTAPRRTATAS
jgi:hypothetical protein